MKINDPIEKIVYGLCPNLVDFNFFSFFEVISPVLKCIATRSVFKHWNSIFAQIHKHELKPNQIFHWQLFLVYDADFYAAECVTSLLLLLYDFRCFMLIQSVSLQNSHIKCVYSVRRIVQSVGIDKIAAFFLNFIRSQWTYSNV